MRIRSITDACVMKATIRIVPWQDGHAIFDPLRSEPRFKALLNALNF